MSTYKFHRVSTNKLAADKYTPRPILTCMYLICQPLPEFLTSYAALKAFP